MNIELKGYLTFISYIAFGIVTIIVASNIIDTIKYLFYAFGILLSGLGLTGIILFIKIRFFDD